MSSYVTEINEQIQILDKLVRKAEKFLASAPEGTLYVSRSRNSFQYHVRKKGDRKNGSYLGKKEREMAGALAQKDYCRRFIECAAKVRSVLLNLEEKGLGQSASVMYEALASVYLGLPPGKRELVAPYVLPPGKRELVAPYVLPNEEFVAQWLSKPRSGPGFKEGTPEIYADRGERVRSKSEKMIADKLFMLGIPTAMRARSCLKTVRWSAPILQSLMQLREVKSSLNTSA